MCHYYFVSHSFIERLVLPLHGCHALYLELVFCSLMFLESGLGLAVSNKNQNTTYNKTHTFAVTFQLLEIGVCHTVRWGSYLIGSSFFFLVIYKIMLSYIQ